MRKDAFSMGRYPFASIQCARINFQGCSTPPKMLI